MDSPLVAPADAPQGDNQVDLAISDEDASPTTDTTLFDTKGPPKPVTITSALSGPTGTTTGTGVILSTDFWPGWRFQVPSGQTFSASKVGIHIQALGTELSIFGSLVALTGPSDDPDKLDLSGPDVIATTAFNMAPQASGSQNVSGTVNVKLDPGWYAVIFGAGRAGTKGLGTAFDNNTKLTGVQNIYVIKQSTQGISYTQSAVRLFVEGTMQ